MTRDTGKIEEYIPSLLNSQAYKSEVAYYKVLPECEEKQKKPDIPFSREIIQMTAGMGITYLYNHQAIAIDHVRSGKNVVVATPTASGKTLIYNIPVFENILKNRTSRALYLFPLKALAQDQLKTFDQMAGMFTGETPTSAIYDGDTTAWFKKKIRMNPPNVLFTNPDMLHLSILCYHEKWATFLSSLDVVVIDEVHTYRGVFGSHISNVLLRLRRICEHYGACPTFILSSATISNPRGLAENLTGLSFETITENGAPQGKKHIVFLDPLKQGPYQAVIGMLKAAVSRNLRTIVYTKSRKMAELISLWAGSRAGKFSGKIKAYRAGLLPEERRKIEADLSQGHILAVISTSALELGIDVGDLDLCILVGYPGTVMSTLQRSGRVGRKGQESAVVLVAGEDVLDQYYMRHPEIFFEKKAEPAVLNPFNPDILKQHLLCAAAELPIRLSETMMDVPEVNHTVSAMQKTGMLFENAQGGKLFPGKYIQHRHVDLRGTGDRYTIFSQATEKVIGEIDGLNAFRETHPGAIYLHQGLTYVVTDLDIDGKTIRVAPVTADYYTRVAGYKHCHILEVFQNKTVWGVSFFFGRIRVTDQVTGYGKWCIRRKKKTGEYALDLPPNVFETDAVWVVVPGYLQDDAEKKFAGFAGGIHAVEHAMIGMLPLFVLADRNDVGGIATPFHPQIGASAIFIYDGVKGGAGITKEAFQYTDPWIRETLAHVKNCECDKGCPACVHSPKCGSGNDPIDKACAIFLLEQMMSSKKPQPVRILTDTPPKSFKPEKVKTDLHYGVFDLETKYLAQEVGGWQNAHKMEVSCVVLYDSKKEDYITYTEENIHAFLTELTGFDLVIGFNNKRFDNHVLKKYTDTDLSSLSTLDLLEDIKNITGFRISLDALARINLGEQKSADGLLAVSWYRQGDIGKVIDYCRDDVRMTKNLYLFGKKHGYLLIERKNEQLRVPVDW